MKTTILLACLFTLSACRSLPPIRSSEIHSNTAVLGVKVKADALGVSITDTYMKAAHAEWDISFPGFSHNTVIKDYQQRLPKEGAK